MSSKEHNQSPGETLKQGNEFDALKEVGELLKQARQEKKINAKDLADSLRIGEEQVNALENALLECLPEEVYINAMIRRISEKLELDPKPLIEKVRAFNPSKEITTDQKEMKRILSDIQDGTFAKNWVSEYDSGLPEYKRLLEEDLHSQIESVGKELRGRMSWLKE